MTQSGDYCSFVKAVEHLGDRWSLLIIRELGLHGPRGFNLLVAGLPGVSRSVLARRLRKLEDFGLIAREVSARSRQAPYVLGPAGVQLLPTLLSLAEWADRWAPEDPAAALHDPDVMRFWLTRRVSRDTLPDPQVVLVLNAGPPFTGQAWLVLQLGEAPSLCTEDPCLPPDRYVHVEADAEAIYPLTRGLRDWGSAIRDRSVRLYGDPNLVRAVPTWFRPADAPGSGAVSPIAAEARR